METVNTGRQKLPSEFEKRYSSEALKARIAADDMWTFIPAVTYSMDSADGIKRLKENQLLFDFIQEYFPDDAYAFEPNMRNGRYVFLPDNSSHQGIGVLASPYNPGYLDVCQFWYPCEYTERKIEKNIDQVCVPAFAIKPDADLAALIRRLYIDEEEPQSHFCTFAFDLDYVVTLKDFFLDDMDATEKVITSALKNADAMPRKNGKGLIEYMKWIFVK